MHYILRGISRGRKSSVPICLKKAKIKSRSELNSLSIRLYISQAKKRVKMANLINSFYGISLGYFKIICCLPTPPINIVNFRCFDRALYKLLPNITRDLHIMNFKITQNQMIRIFCYVEHLELLTLSSCHLEPITHKFPLKKEQKIGQLSLMKSMSFTREILSIFGPELTSILHIISESSLSESINMIQISKCSEVLESDTSQDPDGVILKTYESQLQEQFNLPSIRLT
ncbi:unnamed protein product [Moneuplotes crassus]|uniref:Uncharacterized protein n=1 Tax=Euplotes crassus TaxID=5936 RepID=A0AAD1XQE2_EUPCR|nr:unnamed protein product [Moneuplotes crassus]